MFGCPGSMLAWVMLLMSYAWSPTALAASAVGNDKHLGTATCATSQCHGKNSPQTGRNVQLNEYTIWNGSDYHSRAYTTLESKESRSIARKMGLPNATTAKICLDCHADNVPPEKRGPKFQLSDGVGCEGCHGGAERWLLSHTDPDATHQDNLNNGMIATENAADRAEVCLTCHQGNLDQFATHQIMAAGHPRLSFELDVFTTNQPAHYTVDDDYIKRKGSIDRLDLWLTGQIYSAEQALTVAKGRLYDGEGIFPDFAFFDCHSCHHPMSNLRWSPTRADGVRPGSLRLHLPNLVVLESVISVLGSQAQADGLSKARVNAIRAAQQGRRAFTVAADNLLTELNKIKVQLNTNKDRRDINQVMKSLLNSASADQASDYAEAEQLYLSYETLCYATDQLDQCDPVLEKLFNAIDDEDNFKPGAFASLSKRLGGKAKKRPVSAAAAESSKGRLTIDATPANARVRIMNIVPQYSDGIELDIGAQYDIEVSEDGYKTYRQKIKLSKTAQILNVTLQPN